MKQVDQDAFGFASDSNDYGNEFEDEEPDMGNAIKKQIRQVMQQQEIEEFNQLCHKDDEKDNRPAETSARSQASVVS